MAAAMMKVTSEAHRQRVPALAEAWPEYKRLQERQTELHVESRKLMVERESLQEPVRRAATITERDARVAAIIGDDGLEAVAAERKRFSEIDHRLSDLGAASAAINRRINEAGFKASEVICDQVEPAYRKLVSDFCHRLIDCYPAYAAYHALVDELDAAGVAWSRLYPMNPYQMFGGNPRDRNSRFAHYLRDAASNGFIKIGDVPEPLR